MGSRNRCTVSTPGQHTRCFASASITALRSASKHRKSIQPSTLYIITTKVGYFPGQDMSSVFWRMKMQEGLNVNASSGNTQVQILDAHIL